jgi:hypothetical protein
MAEKEGRVGVEEMGEVGGDMIPNNECRFDARHAMRRQAQPLRPCPLKVESERRTFGLMPILQRPIALKRAKSWEQARRLAHGIVESADDDFQTPRR